VIGSAVAGEEEESEDKEERVEKLISGDSS
jgi:hypothetical protein